MGVEVTPSGAEAPASPSPRRARARRGEGDRLRDEIMAAAELLLAEKGDAEAVSIRAIAEAVGVTPPSIYMHFADKDDLLFAVCERNFSDLRTAVCQGFGRSDDPVRSLHEGALAYVRFGLHRPEAYRILFMSGPRDVPEGFDEERLPGLAAFQDLVHAVQRCIDAGEFRPGDAFGIATGLWAVVHGVTSLLIAKAEFPWPPIDDLLEHLLDVQLRGLRA